MTRPVRHEYLPNGPLRLPQPRPSRQSTVRCSRLPNPHAQAFYRKHGFAADGTGRFDDGVREIRMVRGVQHDGTGRSHRGL
jgi:hypothetical protein